MLYSLFAVLALEVVVEWLVRWLSVGPSATWRAFRCFSWSERRRVGREKKATANKAKAGRTDIIQTLYCGIPILRSRPPLAGMHRSLVPQQGLLLVRPPSARAAAARQVAGHVRRTVGAAAGVRLRTTTATKANRAAAVIPTASVVPPLLASPLLQLSPPSHRAFSSQRAASTATASHDSDTPSAALAALAPFFAATHGGSCTSDAVWHERIQSVLRSSIDDERRTVRLVSLGRHGGGDGGDDDVLLSLLEDALVDHTGEIAKVIARARTESPSGEVTVRYGPKIEFDAMTGVVSLPLAWLRDSQLRLKATTRCDADDLSSDETLTQLYTSPQVMLHVPHDDVFSPIHAPWHAKLQRTLKTFATRPWLTLVVSHRGKVQSDDDAAAVAQRIQQWADTSSSTPLEIQFLDTSKAQAAQSALKAAMGFGSGDRTQEWSRFQSLSSQSGLVKLIDNLTQHVRAGDDTAHLSLLADHAASEITSRLLNAEADIEATRSLATYLATSSTHESQALAKAIEDDVRSAFTEAGSLPALSSSSPRGSSPLLLPTWWKLPFIGDVEVRQRIQEALQDTWLGGDKTEQKLVWWAGRLAELQGKEVLEVQRLVRGGGEGGGGGDVTAAESPRWRHSPLRLPPSLQLKIRAASPSSSSLQMTMLSDPVARARDHLFGRQSKRRRSGGGGARTVAVANANGSANSPAATAASHTAAGVGPAPHSGGTSILDDVQSRVQRAIYRFYSTLGATFLVSTWGFAARAVNATTSASTSSLLAHPSQSTSLAILAFGTTYALYSLQRSHSRLTRRILTRDVLSKIPDNVRAEVSAAVDHAVGRGVYGWRRDVARVLEEWADARRIGVEAERRRWEAVRGGARGSSSGSV